VNRLAGDLPTVPATSSAVQRELTGFAADLAAGIDRFEEKARTRRSGVPQMS